MSESRPAPPQVKALPFSFGRRFFRRFCSPSKFTFKWIQVCIKAQPGVRCSGSLRSTLFFPAPKQPRLGFEMNPLLARPARRITSRACSQGPPLLLMIEHSGRLVVWRAPVRYRLRRFFVFTSWFTHSSQGRGALTASKEEVLK